MVIAYVVYSNWTQIFIRGLFLYIAHQELKKMLQTLLIVKEKLQNFDVEIRGYGALLDLCDDARGLITCITTNRDFRTDASNLMNELDYARSKTELDVIRMHFLELFEKCIVEFGSCG